MGKGNISHIKLVIIELDGCIYPLNKFRYNFYKNLATARDIEVGGEEFGKNLGNMYTMYNELPLAKSIGPQLLNKRVEKDLYNYLTLKEAKPNEGSLELIEYFKQKNIKVAVFSTHKTSRAVDYLRLAHLDDLVDYVIGSDTRLAPLPSTEILSFLAVRYKVQAAETLVVTSMPSLLKAADSIGMNIIFKEDLVGVSDKEKALCYKIGHTMFDMLNGILFGSYEDYKIFEPVLGLTPDLDRNQLKATYESLLESYKDDEELLKVVEKTYKQRLAELELEYPRFIFEDEDEPITQIVDPDTQKFVDKLASANENTPETPDFVDFVKEPTDAEVDEMESSSFEDNPTFLTPIDASLENEDVEEEEEKEAVEKTVAEELTPLDAMIGSDDDEEEEEEIFEEVEESEKTVALNDQDATDLSAVLSQVLKEETPKKSEEEIEEVSEDVKVTRPHHFINAILTIISTLMLALLITFAGILISVIFVDYFRSGPLVVVTNLYKSYEGICNVAMKFILDSLHPLASFVPNYHTFMNGEYLSHSAARLIGVYVINVLIISVIEIIVALIKRGNKE